MAAPVDVLIPTYRRPGALAVTLATVFAQTLPDLRVVVSDQSEEQASIEHAEVRAVVRALEASGRRVELHRHLPRRGMAEQRQFLLDRARARYAAFIDDDVILEHDLFERLLRTILAEGCGFVGSALIGPSFIDDVRRHEQDVEFWDGPVRPERIAVGSREWERYRLHNACNVLHLQRRLGLSPRTQRTYKVAWVGGCVLYDVAALRDVGGFAFHRHLPVEHSGEDVLAQLQVMERYGGCGLLPSGAYHQELPTTVLDRRVDAPRVLR